ncbi:hypothetical protein GQ44DRAFT_759232 [Phaeosphaeriaceae sp. PMI808]|nr:hypothetical protein GQ44DRAFT_759232 [Phaeosphaeriaceae sp. PMI808]
MTQLIAKYAMKKVMSKEMDKYKSKDVAGPYDPYYEEIPHPTKPNKTKKVKKEIPAYIPTQEANVLAKARKTAYRLDYALFTFMGIRFGWSAVIGLIPAIGDAADALLSFNLILNMRKVECGLPGSVLLMMMVNLAIDFLVGLVPFIGDVADAAVKANGKNVRLLEEHLDKVFKPENLKSRDAKLPRERRPRPASVYVDFDDEQDERRNAFNDSSDDVRSPQQTYSKRRPQDEEMGIPRQDTHRSHKEKPARNELRRYLLNAVNINFHMVFYLPPLHLISEQLHSQSSTTYVDMAGQSANQNAILGTSKLTVVIRDLATADETARRVIEMRHEVKSITSIDINIELKEVEEDKEEITTTPEATTSESDLKVKRKERLAAFRKREDEKAALLTLPITQILNTIIENSGSLGHFNWRAPYSSSLRFTRPHAFWTALYRHAPTLCTLHLDFYEHEVSETPAPSIPFPMLTGLTLDTSSAHGDNGTSIATLLKTSPALQKLDFCWPGCDLLTCQIQDISWDDLTYINLTHLTLRGWDFAPQALANFLSRHPTVQVFCDAIDGPDNDNSAPEADRPHSLSVSALPNLNKLFKRDGFFRSLDQYFDTESARQIHHLNLNISHLRSSQITQLAASQQLQSGLRVLELHGNADQWRVPEKIDDSSSEDEEKDKNDTSSKPEAKVVPPPRIPEVLHSSLSKLTNLHELAIGLETGNTMFSLPNGEWGSPDAANVNDLTSILSLLPSTTRIRALRIWDTRGEALPRAFLDDLPTVPDGLEYLGWEGEEKVLYKIERVEGGVVKAVVCDAAPRTKREGSEEEWDEQRILEY